MYGCVIVSLRMKANRRLFDSSLKIEAPSSLVSDMAKTWLTPEASVASANSFRGPPLVPI